MNVSGRSANRQTKPPPLKARMREVAAEAIIDAVEAVLDEHGLEGTSIAAIAERAGVAVGTLYNYFPDRDAMIAALYRARRAEIGPRIAAAAKEDVAATFEVRLRLYVRAVLDAFDTRRRFVRVAIALDPLGRRIADKEPNLMAQFTSHVEVILRDSGRFPTEAIGDYAAMLVGAMKAYNHARIEADLPLDPDGVVNFFLYGIVGKRP
jgi:AcrR family transcriptional regulator